MIPITATAGHGTIAAVKSAKRTAAAGILVRGGASDASASPRRRASTPNMKQYLNKLATADGQRQKAEYHYYTLCSVCDRTMHRTMLAGCNRCRDAPRPADTEAARAAYEKMISRLHEQEEELNRRIATGDGARVTSLVAHRF